ncbi:hypothetical protein NM208_g8873 [Fusarium decemcellulare]|uniref:Uncharacterized protein n=1 Tax=Fusarium decemcellulare TaxID=57161 RepID=A0ACC1S3N2_9HYPO|nr:hypothetical protein NM208_g8873 [Fusarium decemcellulare]
MNEVLPEQLLTYHSAYRVLICTTCQYAIQPQAVDRHLKEIHKIYRSARRPFTAYAAKFDLSAAEDVKAEIIDFPVEFLPVFDGLKCLDDGCTYLCISTKRMQKHWLSAHQRHGYPQVDWQPAPLQTFFRGNLLQYFTGSLDNPSSEKQQVIEPTILPCLEDMHITLPEPSPEELVEHFRTSTAQTMVSQDGHLWLIDVPRMAEHSPFLKHAMLACSALHLATKDPSHREYLICAHSHQNTAMALFREAVAHVNETNCEAIIAFSHLLIVYSFGAKIHDKGLTDPTKPESELLCSWMYFMRNACTLTNPYRDVIAAGPVASLARCWEASIETNEAMVRKATEPLLDMIRNEVGSWSLTDHDHIEDAARKLGRAFASAEVLGDGFNAWYAIRVWPMAISIEFTKLMAAENPIAKVLLGHFCLLLKRLRSLWFIGDYPLRLLYALKGMVDCRWHQYIDPLIAKWKEGVVFEQGD